MDNTFSNYHLVSLSPDNIIEFCKSLFTQLKSLNNKDRYINPISIAVSNLYYMFTPDFIIPQVSRFHINYIPSYRIDTNDNVSLIILNPKSGGMRILKDLELERKYRLNLILNELIKKSIYLNVNSWVDPSKTEYITEVDISNRILRMINSKQLNYEYNTVQAVYDNIVKDIYDDIPLMKYSFDSIIRHLDNETVIIANASDNMDKIEHPTISGIIQTPYTSIEVIEYAKSHYKDILPGTGELV